MNEKEKIENIVRREGERKQKRERERDRDTELKKNSSKIYGKFKRKKKGRNENVRQEKKITNTYKNPKKNIFHCNFFS